MNREKRPLLIVLIAGIGDLVLASKSIRAIRNGFPDADIHLLTSTEAAAIAQNYKYLDHVWAFPIRQLRNSKSHLLNIVKLVVELRKKQFEIVANLFVVASWFGAFRMGLLFLLLKSQLKVGHDGKGFGLFLTKKAPPETFENRHRVDAMMDIAVLAGGIPDKMGIDVFWDKGCEKKWNYLFEEPYPRVNEIIVGVNPGGDWRSKRWSTDNFAIVADKIIEEFNSKIILLGGPGEEDIGREIQQKMKNDAVNPALVGPYASQKLYRQAYKGLDCQPCNNKKCARPICLDMITPDEVYEKCVELLEINKPHLFNH
jgi:ADP-heptose:LPS heptosyltransferase